jgi:hypothetical protein
MPAIFKIVPAVPGSTMSFSNDRPRRPVAAFAGPKLCFGYFRLTPLSYAGYFSKSVLPEGWAAHYSRL